MQRNRKHHIVPPGLYCEGYYATLVRNRVNNHNRRARLAGAPGTFTVNEWLQKLVDFGGRCWFCGSTDEITIDHRVSLAEGGSNSIDNIAPLCFTCNARKGDRMYRVTAELSPEILTALEDYAFTSHTPKAQVLKDALEAYLESKK